MKDVAELVKRFEELENLKREKKGQLSEKVHELYKWIADVRGTDHIYLFPLEESRMPEHNVWFVVEEDEGKGRFIKTYLSCEGYEGDIVNEVGTYYVTYSRLSKLLYTAMERIQDYVEESQKHFNEEFRLNRILNCIKKG